MKQARILPSVLKGIRILELIGTTPKGLRMKDISVKMGIPPSNITLYLNTLINAGMVIRDPLNRKYFISPMILEMFKHTEESLIHRLVPCAEDSMQELHLLFNENVLLGFQKENTVFFIRHISSDHIMSIKIEPEPDIPMHITAAGRALLAFFREKEINSYIKKANFEKVTDKTVSNEKQLRALLKETREKGFAFNPGEFEVEVMALAAPVIVNERPIASLVVQFPSLRHTEEDVLNAAEVIVDKAKIIEQKLQESL